MNDIPSYEEWFNHQKDNYLMDLENCILHKIPYGNRYIDLKKERIYNNRWLKLILENADTDDIETFEKYYKRWVLEGGGDEWFQ